MEDLRSTMVGKMAVFLGNIRNLYDGNNNNLF